MAKLYKKAVPVQSQQWLLAMAFSLLVALSAVLLYLSFKGFEELDQSWRDFSQQNQEMTSALASVREHLGYGGFIHNFKNLVLRRDLSRYQAIIEQNSLQLSGDLARLQSLMSTPEAQQALDLVSETIKRYQTNYHNAVLLIQSGASSDLIDAQVKVDDTGALAALTQLDRYIADSTQQMRITAELKSNKAMQLLMLGALLLAPAMVMVAALLLSIVRKMINAMTQERLAQSKLADLFHSTPDPILVINTDTSLLACNRMAVEFFGYDESQLLSMRLSDLLAFSQNETDPEACLSRLRSSGEDGRVILAAQTYGQGQRMVSVNMSEAGSAELAYFSLILRDVTQQLEDQQALVTAKTVAELALQRQKEIQDELIKSEKLASLSKLVAGVAHEINTPVGIMLTASTVLRDETTSHAELFQNAKMTQKQLSNYFTIAHESSSLICNNCLRAAELIQSFKQVSVDQSSAERRRFHLANYIHEVMVSIGSYWKNTQIQVLTECPEDLEMDSYPGSFAQVLTNLVLNAVNHAFAPGQAGEIRVEVKHLSSDNDWIEMTVTDNGCGIDTEVCDKVFEPFFTTKRNNSGTGLGLHIVQSAVEMVLGGSISLYSTGAKGSCFQVKLPLDISGSQRTDMSLQQKTSAELPLI